MKASYQLQNVGQVEATLSVTMRVDEWTQFLVQLEQLGSIYPAWQFRAVVGDVIRKANEKFHALGESA